MASNLSPNVGAADRANKKASTSTHASPIREAGAERESKSITSFSTSPNRQNAPIEVSGNVTRPSSFNVPTATTSTGTTGTTSAAAPSGAMRTQRRPGRHNPLARPALKKKHGKKQDGENAATATASGPPATNGHDRDENDKDDRLDGVEADIDDLVGPDTDPADPWEEEFPGLVEKVKAIACLSSSVRGIHDNSEEGLRFMARGMNLD